MSEFLALVKMHYFTVPIMMQGALVLPETKHSEETMYYCMPVFKYKER